MRIRIFPKNNYFAVWKDNIAIRFQIEDDKPITELEYPEFLDVKITDKCTGKCPFCYMNSLEEGEHYNDILDKVQKYFGSMNTNQRPFQIAIGGGNPNEHPDFCALLKLVYDLGITPNYTTNGIGITEEVIEATKKYSGGVAISTHPHLLEKWQEAFWLLHDSGFTNLVLQTIISDQESIDYFAKYFNLYKDYVKYHVLLPYETMGRAEPKEIDYPYLEKTLDKIEDNSKLAFGANFYPWLQTTDYGVMLYEPEIMSAFLDLKDMKLYKSSFNLGGKMKYFNETTSDKNTKTLYLNNSKDGNWRVEICKNRVYINSSPVRSFSVDEIQEMMDWIDRNTYKKVYILHKEFDYDPIGDLDGVDISVNKEDFTVEYG